MSDIHINIQKTDSKYVRIVRSLDKLEFRTLFYRHVESNNWVLLDPHNFDILKTFRTFCMGELYIKKNIRKLMAATPEENDPVLMMNYKNLSMAIHESILPRFKNELKFPKEHLSDMKEFLKAYCQCNGLDAWFNMVWFFDIFYYYTSPPSYDNWCSSKYHSMTMDNYMTTSRSVNKLLIRSILTSAYGRDPDTSRFLTKRCFKYDDFERAFCEEMLPYVTFLTEFFAASLADRAKEVWERLYIR